MEETNLIVDAINTYGFPIIAATAMGYFIFFVWKWVTETMDPLIGDTMVTLIKLVDRVRMLDNDMIRMNTKIAMVLEYKEEIEKNIGRGIDEDLGEILSSNKTMSKKFNSTGVDNGHKVIHTQDEGVGKE